LRSNALIKKVGPSFSRQPGYIIQKEMAFSPYLTIGWTFQSNELITIQ